MDQRVDNLIITKMINQEVAHYNDSQLNIFSKFNVITIIKKGHDDVKIKLPITPFQRLLGLFRLTRRLFRLDKSCVVCMQTGYVAFWQGKVYHIAYTDRIPRCTLTMIGCRNPMHNSIAKIDDLNLYFGEYGQPHPAGKSVYHSADGGRSWKKVFNIPAGKIRHIHSCKWDPFEKKIWLLTGDFEGQSYLISADPDFKNIEWIGDGSQKYRAVDAIFEQDVIHWIMDSPLSSVSQMTMNRKTHEVVKGQDFPGPVWYLKSLSDDLTVCASVQEVGPSHTDEYVHLYYTKNRKDWIEVAHFEHDGFKKGIMKFGVCCFSEGNQTSDSFYIHFEAIKNFDGKVALCKIVK